MPRLLARPHVMINPDCIRNIITQSAITTFLQPIVHIEDRCIWGYEALSRGPIINGLRAPSDLAKLAEAAGIHSEFECACIFSAMSNFKAVDLDGRLFVNMSYETLCKYEQLEPTIYQAITQHEFDPTRIVIELTEHSPTHDIERLKGVVAYLRAKGFAIALDDLGAGYSSLKLWSELNPDYIKFDRYFIDKIESDTVKQRFVRTLTDLARSQGCQVIAEGVQTRREAEWLSKMQVTLMQGFYFALPKIHPFSLDLTRIPDRDEDDDNYLNCRPGKSSLSINKQSANKRSVNKRPVHKQAVHKRSGHEQSMEKRLGE